MKKHDFYYDLPNELIAQTPIEPRDASRMMVVNRQTGEIEHKHFYDVVDYLNPGDCLILNDTKVLPARLRYMSEASILSFVPLSLYHRRSYSSIFY